ncbi:MAG: Ig-like domain-containing protein [Oscillospiraceae bacterium]|nr:Ig-like domain-containing protein [Oscillospiraceae bacterium]
MQISGKIKKWVLIPALAVLIAALSLPIAGTQGITAAAAAADLNVISATASPPLETIVFNKELTITVQTSTSVTKVRVAYPSGGTYNLADINSGSTNYTDSGSVRTWTLTSWNQLIGNRIYWIYAGDATGYGDYTAIGGPSNWPHEPEAPATPTVSLNKSTVSLNVGAQEALTATVLPANYANKTVNWSTGNPSVATVSNGQITAVAAGSCVVTAALAADTTVKATCTVTVTAPSQTEPPYPFWQDYKAYATANTRVYYQGNIYYNSYYANIGDKPTSGGPWVLVGPAEWTVPEDEKNYQKDPNGEGSQINKVLTDSEVTAQWGGINPAYSADSALDRLEELIPETYYNELFPYRFGSTAWKAMAVSRQYYPNYAELPDYYSYQNLQEAVATLANTIIKVEWYNNSTWCYRIIRLNKETKEQRLVYSDPDFTADWIADTPKTSQICDYGSFLAVGDLSTRKKELAAFLGITCHETGGGSIDGTVDELYSGYYFNEEVGYIGSSSVGYTSASTIWPAVPGKSYHGRGPIQLSYNFNYGLCSDVLYGDKNILLNNPDLVEQDGVLGFMTGIWFWMTPQPPKPSCHECITGIWNPAPGTPNAQFNGQFGLTIVIVNNESGRSENGADAVGRRCRYFRAFCTKMGVDLGTQQVDTVGMVTFSS